MAIRKSAVVFAVMAMGVPAGEAGAQNVTLNGWAAIPSTFRQPGPVSGQFAGPSNGVTPPYQGQVIPGFSGMIPSGRAGEFIGMPDNGFGGQGNSADYVLGFYNITPSFRTTGNGTSTPGSVAVGAFTAFKDPRGLVNASYVTGGPVYGRTNYYPAPAAQIAVDAGITGGKLLTGADFDVESITKLDDGSFWVGEEFGPYLLNFSAEGNLLRAPIRHPVLRAPQNPQNTTRNPPNLPSSQGFESMTRNADGSKLYLTTESSINSEQDKRNLEIYEFDTATASYTNRILKYRKDSSDAIPRGNPPTLPAQNNSTSLIVTGDIAHITGDRYVIIERDDFQGPPNSANPPVVKRLYLIDLNETDSDGVLKKRLLVDLLNIADPEDIGGPLVGIPANVFNFPLLSVECVTVVDAFTLAVALDNNYPGGNGRIPGTPDDTEIITLRFDVPLASIVIP